MYHIHVELNKQTGNTIILSFCFVQHLHFGHDKSVSLLTSLMYGLQVIVNTLAFLRTPLFLATLSLTAAFVHNLHIIYVIKSGYNMLFVNRNVLTRSFQESKGLILIIFSAFLADKVGTDVNS